MADSVTEEEISGTILLYNWTMDAANATTAMASCDDLQALDEKAKSMSLPNLAAMCTSTIVCHGNKANDFVPVQVCQVNKKLHTLNNELSTQPRLFNHYQGQHRSAYVWVPGVRKPPSVTHGTNLLENVAASDLVNLLNPLQDCVRALRHNALAPRKHLAVCNRLETALMRLAAGNSEEEQQHLLNTIGPELLRPAAFVADRQTVTNDWPSTDKWIIDSVQSQIFDLSPGMGVPNCDVSTALHLTQQQVRQQIQALAMDRYVCTSRTGTIRPTKATTYTEILVHSACTTDESDAPHNEGANHIVWVCDCLTLRDLVLNVHDIDIYNCGVIVHQQQSATMGNTITVAPQISSLPLLDTDGTLTSRALREDRTLFLVTIVDVHQLVHFYECLNKCRTKTTQHPMPALHAFLGISPKWNSSGLVHEILGPMSERRNIVTTLEQEFDAPMTNEEKVIVMNANKACINIDSVAGGRKNLLLLMFVWCAMTHIEDDDNTIIWLAAPTNNTALKLFNCMVRVLGSAVNIGHVGLDKTTNADCLDTKIVDQQRSETAEETHTLKCFDAIIHGLTMLLSVTTNTQTNALPTMSKVLALRHEYLDSHVYQKIREAQTTALLRIKIAVSTTTHLMKMQTDAATYWARQLLKRSRKILAVDECHRVGWPVLAAVISTFDFTLLLGDRFQEKHNHFKQQKCSDPLKTHSATKWIKQNGGIQKFILTTSRRVGDTMIDVLTSINSDKYGHLSSMETTDTLVLPIIFAELPDKISCRFAGGEEKSNPILRSETFFTRLLLWLAYAVILCAHQNSDTNKSALKTIGIIWCLEIQLEEFKAYAKYALQSSIHNMHALTGWPLPACAARWYSLETLLSEGLLTITTPEGCCGLEFWISFNVWLKRDAFDHGYRGQQSEPHNIYTMLTRGSQFTFIFIEDLRISIIAPYGGSQRAEMLRLGSRDLETEAGAKRRKIDCANNNKQLQFLRLIHKCINLIYGQLQVPTAHRHTINADQYNPNYNITTAISHSQRLLRELDAIDTRAGAAFQTLSTPNVEWQLLEIMVGNYRNMTGWWPADHRPTLEQTCDIRTFLNSAAVLEKILTRNPICQSKAAPCDPALPDLHNRYSRETQSDSNMPDPPNDFTEEAVLLHWKSKIIPAVTMHVSHVTEYIVILPCVNTNTYNSQAIPQQDVRTLLDASWLAKVLTDRTHEIITAHDANLHWTKNTERQKKDELTLNGYKHILEQSESDRPSFVIRDNADAEVHNCYWATGLTQQHDAQLILLARIYNIDVLAAYLLAVTSMLDVKLYYHNLCVFREPHDEHLNTRRRVETKLEDAGITLHKLTDPPHGTEHRLPVNNLALDKISSDIDKWNEWPDTLTNLMHSSMGIDEGDVHQLANAWSTLSKQYRW